MSSLPPNLVGSILQSHLASRQVSNVREAKRSQDENSQRIQSAAIDEEDSTVETTDNDTQVHTDAKGSGSQGRAFSEAQAEEELEQSDDQFPEDEGQHIDLEA